MSRQVKEGNTKGRENKRGGEKRESTVYGNGQGNKRVNMLWVGSVYPQSKTWFYEVLHFWLQLIPFHVSFKALETLEFIIQCVSHLWQLNTWTKILEPKK